MTSAQSDALDRRLAAFGLCSIAVYFYRLTRPTLRAGFSPDDCMNLYRAWFYPLPALIKANLLFFLPSDFIRPLAEAWYRAIYFFAGFRAGPFHAVDLCLLLVDIVLVYFLARRLADSRFTALVTALLFAYQERWAPLYFDTGYIFDVLCGFFVFGAMLFYLRIRQSGRTPRIVQSAALFALYICALNAKEMAVALPVTMALYEFLYEQRRHYVTSAAIGAMAIAFIAGRAGALTPNPAYRPVFTASRFMDTSAHFIGELFAAPRPLPPAGVLVFAAALLAVAIALRSRPMIYAWAFTAVFALPLAFIPPRGGPQYYIPLFGCSLYAGAFFALIADRIPPLRTLPFAAKRAAAACILIAIAWPIYANGKYVALRDVTSITIESPVVMSLAARMRQLRPSLPHFARVLFLNDPIAPDIEDLLFIVRLTYRDRTIEVERVSQTHSMPSANQLPTYDAIFDYGAAGLTEVLLPPPRIEPRLLKFFDADWKPITTANAAKPGAHIIALASDLGPTRPEVPQGSAFPREPLATALLRLEVTVNGQPAAVTTQVGQPGEVNIYRFDFILPKSIPPGSAKIKISAAGVQSPAAEIPVRQ